jgi:hypothetical protein
MGCPKRGSLESTVLIAPADVSVLAGAPGLTVHSQLRQGVVYRFVRPRTGWRTTSVPAHRFLASGGAAFDFFGGSVAVSGNTVVVGATGHTIGSNQNQGTAYVFGK